MLCSMQVELVNDIMAVALLSSKDFDPKRVLELWLRGPLGSESHRGRYLKGKLNEIKSGLS